MAEVTFPSRFAGPPDSANGGYACGVTAGFLGGAPALVTLRLPPPLDRPLRVERADGTSALFDGDDLVVEARAGAAAPEPLPAPVSLDDALSAATSFDVEGYAAAHPFPGCFTCGPHRAEHDGLRLFPAPTGHDHRLVAWPWTPDASTADPDGLVAEPIVWAALDCPSGLTWINAPAQPEPAVLGRLGVVIHRRPAPGERLVVAGWQVAADGRKRHAGSAVWSAAGETLAAGAATWIVLRSEQQSFRTATT
jgi:hypothetical protein